MFPLIKFFRLSLSERLLILEAAFLLGLARLAVIVLPFRWIARVLKRQNNICAVGETADQSVLLIQRRVSWAIRRTGVYTPWRSNCLAKAIAGRFMLRRRRIPSTIYFGMAKDDAGQFQAHAWLSCGETSLIGGAEAERFAVVAIFTD